MTINIEYEGEEKLNIPYEQIINEVIEEALDYESCPYEAEVNVILTDNESIRQINLEYRQIDKMCIRDRWKCLTAAWLLT